MQRYNYPGISSSDHAYGSATDGAGNVIVTGESDDGNTSSDMLTIKYSGAGVPLWTNRFNGLGNYDDAAYAVAIDGSGNVFVTGCSGGDYATIAYSGSGSLLWSRFYNGPDNSNDCATALAVDGSGNVFVTGRSYISSAMIAYSGTGVPLWTNRYGGTETDIAADDTGNIFVTGALYGSNENDYATIAYSGSGLPLWTNRYDGPASASDIIKAVAVDGSGNIFVTGSSEGVESSFDYATVAYSNAGLPLWTNRYNGPANDTDAAVAVAVSSNGNVFVTGYSSHNGVFLDYDYATVAYSSKGVPLWTNRYNGPANYNDEVTAIAVDGEGNVFVTGKSASTNVFPYNYDYATIAYSFAGVPLWTNRYSGQGGYDDIATTVSLDGNGNVLVAGYSREDYVTLGYSGAGVSLWTNRYSGPANFNYNDEPMALTVSGNGNVIVTGFSGGDFTGIDYATIAYSASAIPLWTNRYNGPANLSDAATDMAVDRAGNVFVTGYSYGGVTLDDYATIAYSAIGIPMWTNRYSSSQFDDRPSAIVVDDAGNVFVTGSSGNGRSADYATVAYSASGVMRWIHRYNGPGSQSDSAKAVAVDGSGNIFVTGSSQGSGSSSDYATIAYSNAGNPLWTNRFNGGPNNSDTPTGLAVDGSGNVFVTGYTTQILFDDDYATVAYSGTGLPLWTNRYNGTAGKVDRPTAIAVDNSGNVVVTGYSQTAASSFDYVTIAYTAAGVRIWTSRYNGSTSVYMPQTKASIAIGPDNEVYVTGASDDDLRSESAYDYATIKFVWRSKLAVQQLSPHSPNATLAVSGGPNSSWPIQRAVGILGPWTNVGIVLIGTNGVGLFQDTQRPVAGAFYRAMQP